MAKRIKRRFSALDENKNLEREETKSVDNPKIIEDVVPVEPVLTQELIYSPKRIARNYNFDGELLEKFDALIWHERLTASDTIHEALKRVLDAIPKNKMDDAMNTFKSSKDYKGKEYYYKKIPKV